MKRDIFASLHSWRVFKFRGKLVHFTNSLKLQIENISFFYRKSAEKGNDIANLWLYEAKTFDLK